MPVSQQVARLKWELESRGSTGFVVLQPDLYELEGVDRDVALSAVAAGEPSPFVIVDGRLVATGAVQVDAVLGALA